MPSRTSPSRVLFSRSPRRRACSPWFLAGGGALAWLACAAAPPDVSPWGGSRASAAEPLHKRIDALTRRRAGDTPLAPPADDAEFARRVYLDLAGRVPTASELRAFLAQGEADKRARLIEQRLAAPEYARRMSELFHVMLMERRGDHDGWLRFLRTSFENNVPWDQFARDVLRPNAADEAKNAAAFFYATRLVSEGANAPVDVPALTRDVGRLFAGVDLQCAQCHDHIDIESYKQHDFQGLHLIFTNLKTSGDAKTPKIEEKLLTAKVEFKSVFTEVAMHTGPKIPGAGEVEIPQFEQGQEYLEPPDPKKRAPGVPKFSPLGELGARLAAPGNAAFNRNIVNRLWFVMLGRGLVEPLDAHHAANPPSHPELLDLLAREFTAQKYDVKWLLREIALSEAYQRASAFPAPWLAEGRPPPDPRLYAVAPEKRVSAEQFHHSVLTALGEVPADEAARKALRDALVKNLGNAPKEPETTFNPTVQGALFLLNDEQVLALTRPQPGNLLDRVGQLADDQAAIEELFVSILSRSPTAEDREDAANFLKAGAADRAKALGHLAWALLASNEFGVNH